MPLRAIAVTTVDPGSPRAASHDSLHAGMVRLRKKWSLPLTKRTTAATSDAGSPDSTRSGTTARRNSEVPARLRLCPSSPICSICAMIAVTSTPPARRTADCSAGPSTADIQRSRSRTSGPYAP